MVVTSAEELSVVGLQLPKKMVDHLGRNIANIPLFTAAFAPLSPSNAQRAASCAKITARDQCAGVHIVLGGCGHLVGDSCRHWGRGGGDWSASRHGASLRRIVGAP